MHAISHSGSVAFGHGAIMSMFGAATPLVTTSALRPFASVASALGSASAVAASIESWDEASIGFPTPNSTCDFEANSERRGDSSFGIAPPPPQKKSCIQGAGPPNSRANPGAAASSTNPNPTASQAERDPV